MKLYIKALDDFVAEELRLYLDDLNGRFGGVDYICTPTDSDVCDFEINCSNIEITTKISNNPWIEFRYHGRNYEYMSIYFDRFAEFTLK